MVNFWIPNIKRHPNKYFHDFQEKLTKEFTEAILNKVLQRFDGAKNFDEALSAIYYWNEVKSHLATHFECVELAFQRHTLDQVIEAEEKRLREEIEPTFTALNAKIRKKVLDTTFRKGLEQHLGDQYFLRLQIEEDTFDPQNIAIETELGQVMADYTKLTGQASFEVDGKKYPISHYRRFATHPDASLRKVAFSSYSQWYLSHRDDLELLYDQAIEKRERMAKNLRFNNFIPLAYRNLQRVDYGPDEVKAFREEIKKVMVPLSMKIRKKQAAALGQKQVSYWDTDFFPDWKVGEPKISVAEELSVAQKVYEKISPKLAGYFKKMLDYELIDLEAREGKGPGAFCTDFSDFRVPFLFLNSVHEASDITTLLHESGHAFQAWESRHLDMLELRWPTLEACEVHSMSMEFLAYPYYEDFFTPMDAKLYRQKHLAESILILPYIAMVDEFQHLVYSGQAIGAAGRTLAWKKLEETYLPDMDASGAEDWRNHRWIRQLHIFRAPFYYIDYAIAQVGAWQLWAQSVDNQKAAIENYLQLCQLGGTLPLVKFFEKGNLKLPFQTGMLEELMERVLKIQPL